MRGAFNNHHNGSKQKTKQKLALPPAILRHAMALCHAFMHSYSYPTPLSKNYVNGYTVICLQGKLEIPTWHDVRWPNGSHFCSGDRRRRRRTNHPGDSGGAQGPSGETTHVLTSGEIDHNQRARTDTILLIPLPSNTTTTMLLYAHPAIQPPTMQCRP